MTKVVHQLVEDGHAERVTDPQDSRASLINVTTSGLTALAAWRAAIAAALEPMFTGVSDEERSSLEHAVSIITARTDASVEVA